MAALRDYSAGQCEPFVEGGRCVRNLTGDSMTVLTQQVQDAAPWPFQVAWLLLFFGPWIYALVHAIKRSEEQFRAVASSKTLWIILLVVATTFAAVPYIFTVRRRLNRLPATA